MVSDTTTVDELDRGTVAETDDLAQAFLSGVAGGLVGGVAMGVILHLGANVMPLIGGLGAWPTVAGGWTVHLLIAATNGVLFGLIVSRPMVRSQLSTRLDYVVGGMVFAAGIGLFNAGVLLPIAMALTGVAALPDPVAPIGEFLGEFLVVLSVGVAHVVFGLVLGFAYAEVSDRIADTEPQPAADS